MCQPSTPKSSQHGVVLLEAMIAILIFSMGVLAIVGLQAAMIKNTADSKFRADASYIAQQEIGRIWVSGVNCANYVAPNPDISDLLPNGRRTVVQPIACQFVVTITWQQPGAGEVLHNFTTIASINGG